MVVFLLSFLVSFITSEKCSAPPSLKSSRSTEVITTCFKLSSFVAFAIFNGSNGSKDFGFPVLTSQNPHALVQVSPMIINVACLLLQHSVIFGQFASWQTVFKLFLLIMLFVKKKL